MNMIAYDRIILETYEDKILQSTDHDFEAR